MNKSVSFSFVHCADLHLDSPFEGLHAVEPDVAALLREATFKAFDNVIDLAVRERVDFLIVAGDVYDGEDRSLRAQLRFRDGLRRAAEAGIRALVAHGNHDPLSGWEAGLQMPEQAQRFGGQEVEGFTVSRGGEVLAQVYGISFPIREMRTNLIPKFPRAGTGPFNIGVLHCNVGGDPDHDNYAPCTVADLVELPMDYWALGHVHSRRILRERRPCIAYPGNTQGRNRREAGAKGCLLVRVDESGSVATDFVATDVVRWFSRQVDIGPLAGWDELLAALARVQEEVRESAQGRPAILRVNLAGRGELHGGLRRRLDLERDVVRPLRESESGRTDFVWMESVQDATRPPLDLTQRRRVQDFVGDFLNAAQAIREQEEPAEVLRRVLAARPEHRLILAHLEGLAEEDLIAILSEAETLGLDFLLPEEE